MLNVAILTADDPATGRPRGCAALALALAFNGRGHRVHLITARCGLPLPMHEERGLIVMHRLSLRRPVKDADFAINACRHVAGLSRAGQCDVVEWLDPPESALAWGAAAALALRCDPMPPVVALRSDGAGGGATACHAVVHLDEVTGPEVHIPLPIDSRVALPPRAGGRLLVATDALSPEAAQRVVAAYRRAGVGALGWALALPDAAGDWTTLAGEGAGGAGDGDCRVTLALTRATPAMSLHGLARGELAVAGHRSPLAAHVGDTCDADDVASIAAAIGAAVHLPDAARRDRAREVWSVLAASHEPATSALAHERLWDSLHPLPPWRRAMDGWRRLERLARQGGAH